MNKLPDEIQKKYERFKLEWMLAHGYTLADLVKELGEIQEDCEPGEPIGSIFDMWEHDVGFGSEIWPCFDEWRECEGKEPQMSDTGLRRKLERCLKVAMSREDLGCQIPHIVLTLADVMRNPAYHSPTMEVWCNYFLERNETPATGTHRLHLTCPRCGNTGWIRRDDGWECAACGEFAYTEDMGTAAEEIGGDTV